MPARLLSPTLLFILLLCMLGVESAQAQGSLGTSASPFATGNSAQRKVFFDAQNKKYWGFFFDGESIAYSASADGRSWGFGASILPYATSDFSVTTRLINGTSYVFLVAQVNNYDVVLRRGTVTATGINFESEILVFDGTGTSDYYKSVTLAVSQNGTLWVGAVHGGDGSIADNQQIVVKKSTGGADGSLSPLGSIINIGRQSGALRDPILLPQSGDTMYLVVDGDGSNIVGYHYDGTSWSSANNGGDLSWFNFAGAGINGTVRAVTIYGATLYIGGDFTRAGGASGADFLARWNGSAWEAVATLDGPVFSLAIGNGNLYVGGDFNSINADPNINKVASYDGTSWAPFGVGLSAPVRAIAVNGTNVYVGGDFTSAGGVTGADGIALWDGTNWNALLNGVSGGSVFTIALDASDIYVGGNFTSASGVSNTAGIARYTGTSWTALNSGLTGEVHALLLDSLTLYVGGNFTSAGGVSGADNIAIWSIGSSLWFALSSGVNGEVDALTISGTDLYLGGQFTGAGGVSGADRVARYDTVGTTYQMVGTSLNNSVFALLFFGSDLITAGDFSNAGGSASADHIAQFSAGSWIGYGQAAAFNDRINAMTIYGGMLYIGGKFTDVANDPNADYIVSWDGSSWRSLGSVPPDDEVYALTTFNGNLYVGGAFQSVDGNSAAARLAKWNGTTWSDIDGAGLNGTVFALTSDASGVYVGGEFDHAGGLTNADGIAYWNGTIWNALGSGISVATDQYGVHAIAINGSDIYAGGTFLNAGGAVNTSFLARWNGSTWQSLNIGPDNAVYALVSTATDLYVGGKFVQAGGTPGTSAVARFHFSDSSWNALGTGLSDAVYSLLYSGGTLFAGGIFKNAGGDPAVHYLARFDGSTWVPVDDGPDHDVRALALFNNELYIAGQFENVAGRSSTNFAKYGPAIGQSISATFVSAASDDSAEVYVLFTDWRGAVLLRTYDGTIWASTVELIGGGAQSASISINPAGKELFATYSRAGNIIYRAVTYPYTSASIGPEFNLDASGFSENVTTLPRVRNARTVLIWSSGGDPFDIRSDIIASAANISGRVSFLGSALANVTLDGGSMGTQTTDSAGIYSFLGVEKGSAFSITPMLAGYAFSPNPASGTLLTDTMQDFAASVLMVTISGHVTVGGQALANVLIDGGPLGTRLTGPLGEYSFSVPYGSPYALMASQKGYIISPSLISGNVTADATIDFTALKNPTISGTVTTSSGRPVPGATVVSAALGTTLTDTDGKFFYQDVIYGTSYIIDVSRSGYNFVQTQVSGNATADTNYAFTADRQTYAIRGRVTVGGKALSGAELDGGALGTTTTDVNGDYAFSGLPAGTLFSVHASLKGYSITPSSFAGKLSGDIEASFSATKITFTLSGAIKIRGKGLEGVLVDGGRLGKRVTKADGKFLFSAVSPDTDYSITPSLSGFTFSPPSISGVLNRDTALVFKVQSKAAYGGAIVRASIASDGTESDSESDEAAISGDGNSIVFSSTATSLDESDTNGMRDVFLRNLTTGNTTLISRNMGEELGNGESGAPLTNERAVDITSDGTLLVYSSVASNLVSDDYNSASDIFLYDVAHGAQTLLSTSAQGAQGNGASYGPSVGTAGSIIAFTSESTNLIDNDVNAVADVFIKTVADERIERASIATDGSEANGPSGSAALSGDASLVAFASDATNLVANDSNGSSDIFLRSLHAATTTRVSISSNGLEANGASSIPAISANGRFIAFQSEATNLVEGDTNGVSDVFVHDLVSGTTERVSVTSSGEQGLGASGFKIGISADGRYITYASDAANLAPDDSNGVRDIFVHDRTTHRTGIVSRTIDGKHSNGASQQASVSLDGQHFGFVSRATNLVSDDKNAKSDVFVATLPDLPKAYVPNVKIEKPPVLVVESKNLTIVMQPFFLNNKPKKPRGTAAPKKQTIVYVVSVQNSRRKNDIRRTVSKRNTLTVRNLKPGRYSVRYQAKLQSGGNTISKSQISPKRSFTVRK